MSDAELSEELNVLSGRLVAQQYVGEDLREARSRSLSGQAQVSPRQLTRS